MSLSSLSRPPLLRLLFLVLLLRPPEWIDVVSDPGLLGGESFTMLLVGATAVVIVTWPGWQCVVTGGGVGLVPALPRLPLLLLLFVLVPVPAAATVVVVMVVVTVDSPVVEVVITVPLLPRFCLRPFSGFSVDCVLQSYWRNENVKQNFYDVLNLIFYCIFSFHKQEHQVPKFSRQYLVFKHTVTVTTHMGSLKKSLLILQFSCIYLITFEITLEITSQTYKHVSMHVISLINYIRVQWC